MSMAYRPFHFTTTQHTNLKGNAMGDISDMADIDRFMRSSKGTEHLASIKTSLIGRTIEEVTFSNEISCVAVTFRMDDGTTYLVREASLELHALREEFGEVLDEEYYKDFPERRKLVHRK